MKASLFGVNIVNENRGLRMREVFCVLFLFTFFAVFAGETPPLPEKTTVSASLDVAHAKGQNLVWCDTFQLAWNAMGTDLCGEPVRLEGTPAFEKSMNSSTVSAKDVDAESVLVKVGKVRRTFVDELNAELKKRFRDNAPAPLKIEQKKDGPEVLAYAFLYKNLAFAKPLDKQQEPFEWRGEEGSKTPVQAFGIVQVTEKNEAVAKQIQLINNQRGEYIIELKSKSDADPLILAQVKPGATLKDTLETVRKIVAKPAHEIGRASCRE